MAAGPIRSRDAGKHPAWMITHFDMGCTPHRWRGVKYMAYQREAAPTTGRLHLQMYVVFNYAVTRRSVLSRVGPCHCEPRCGSHEDALLYCTREFNDDGSRKRVAGTEAVIWGTPPQAQGARNDLLAVQEALETTGSMRIVARDHFATFLRYNRGMMMYLQLQRASGRDWQTEVQVYHGPPGTGKSRRALAEAGPDAYWLPRPNCNTVWWDGYDGQAHVVIDEFYGWIPHSFMLVLCDRYPLMLPTRHGATACLIKKIWITSNRAPADWWPNVGLGGMSRRLEAPIGIVEEMLDEWVPEPPPLIPIDSSDDDEPATPPRVQSLDSPPRRAGLRRLDAMRPPPLTVRTRIFAPAPDAAADLLCDEALGVSDLWD